LWTAKEHFKQNYAGGLFMATKRALYKNNMEDFIIDSTNYFILALIMIITLYPFINTLAVSFNDAIDTVRGGIYLWPRKFTLINYKVVLGTDAIYNATLISVLRAIVGAVVGINASFIVGYALSRKEFVLRKLYSKMFVYSMYFYAGLLPVYFLMKDLHLRNSFLVYILPGVVSAWNIIVIRSFIDGIPPSFIESAKMDGASEFRTMYSIVFPLCMPVNAAIALFVAVGQWNSWFDTMLYCSSVQGLSTLQFELQKMLQTSQKMATGADMAFSQQNSSGNTITPVSLKATMIIVSVVPILCVYPFLQKYFVKGITLGGIKG
jgi:putative aldouronate transport system permease protein